jgi:starch phosphorylase
VDAVPQVGDELHVRATVELDGLSPDDVSVEVIYGRARDSDRLDKVERQELQLAEHEDGHPLVFAGTVALARAGSFGYNVRVVPRHPLLVSAAEMGLISVAQ